MTVFDTQNNDLTFFITMTIDWLRGIPQNEYCIIAAFDF